MPIETPSETAVYECPFSSTNPPLQGTGDKDWVYVSLYHFHIWPFPYECTPWPLIIVGIIMGTSTKHCQNQKETTLAYRSLFHNYTLQVEMRRYIKPLTLVVQKSSSYFYVMTSIEEFELKLTCCEVSLCLASSGEPSSWKDSSCA